MLKLKKFQEKKLNNKNIIISMLILICIISVVVISKSYAIYKVEKKYDLIKAKIGDFRGKNQVINYFVNNEVSDVIPDNKNYVVSVECENATGTWNNTEWKLEISGSKKYTVTCNVNFKEKYVIASAKSTSDTITATYSNIANVSESYYLYGIDKNNLNQKNSSITSLNSNTTYYLKKCYKDDIEICSDISSLLTAGGVYSFDYTKGEQTFTAPANGTYKLETWGASGGYAYDLTRATGAGGYGGYSTGDINLINGKKIYLNIGGKGEDNCQTKSCIGGYNGGSNSSKWANFTGEGLYTGGGGGATHIATKSGLLSTLENSKSSILIVSGGGGGGDYYPKWGNLSTGSSGGGFKGVNSHHSFDLTEHIGTAGTQNSGGYFGKALTEYTSDSTGGSGGGYYGGISSYQHSTGAGGSGYIGNPLLTNKAMYCYNCQESSEESTKTISTICTNETPTENCAKKGNGYAKITIEECFL